MRVTASTDGRFVYVTSEEDNQVSVIDTATNRLVKQFAVGARPRLGTFCAIDSMKVSDFIARFSGRGR